MPLEFDEEKSYTSRAILGAPTMPRMLQLILKTGVVKSEKQAMNILFAIIILFFFFSIIIFFKVPSKLSSSEPKYFEDLPLFMQEEPAFSDVLPRKNQ